MQLFHRYNYDFRSPGPSSVTKSLFKPKDILYNEFKNKPDKPIEFSNQLNNVIEIDTSVTGRLYPSKDSMMHEKLIFHHNKTSEKLSKYMAKVPKPQITDFESNNDKIYKDKQKVAEIWKNKKSKNSHNNGHDLHIIEEDMMDEFLGDMDSEIVSDNQVLVEALQMNFSNRKVDTIEIKNEQQLVEVDFKTLISYEKLQAINFSMNSIAKIFYTGKKEFVELTKLQISQNKIEKFDKKMFDKLPNLKTLIADINLLASMDGIEN